MTFATSRNHFKDLKISGKHFYTQPDIISLKKTLRHTTVLPQNASAQAGLSLGSL